MNFVDFIKNYHNKNKEDIEKMQNYPHPFLKNDEGAVYFWKKPGLEDKVEWESIPVFKNLIDEFMEYFFYSKEIKIALKGHFRMNGNKTLKTFNDELEEDDRWNPLSYEMIRQEISSTVVDMFCISPLKPDSDKWFKITNEELVIASSVNCSDCGQPLGMLAYRVDEGVILPFSGGRKIDDCLFNGDLLIEASLRVPSGKLVFANDLRHLFTAKEKERVSSDSVNYFTGRKKQTLNYAELGLLFASVGNSSPDVYKSADNKEILIGNFFSEDESYRALLSGSTHEGSICTDLWWFCAMDFDNFKRRKEIYQESKGEEHDEYDSGDYFVVEVAGKSVCLMHYAEFPEEDELFSRIVVR